MLYIVTYKIGNNLLYSYMSLIYKYMPGADPGGGLWGLDTPPLQTVLILKQALQIIILIGAKTIII